MKTTRLYEKFGGVSSFFNSIGLFRGLSQLDQSKLPNKLSTIANEAIIDIATGNGNIFYLTDTGKVFFMGDNSRGQGGTSDRHFDYFTQIPLHTPIKQMSIGLQHCLFQDHKGSIYGCGASNYFQIAPKDQTEIEELGKIKQFTTPIEVYTEINKVKYISTGHFHTILANDTEIASNGFNIRGQCGKDNFDHELVPRPALIKTFDEGETIKEIYSGNCHNIIKTNQKLYFMGNRSHYQLPDELTSSIGFEYVFFDEIFLKQQFGYDLTDITQINAKFDKTAIVFKNGDALLFGNIQNGDEEKTELIEHIKAEETGYKIKHFCPGVQWDLKYVEYY